MKKLFIPLGCFITSFFITLFFTLPYDCIYSYLLKNSLDKYHIGIFYKSIEAHPFSLNLADVLFIAKKRPVIKIEKIKFRISPISYIRKNKIISVHTYQKSYKGKLDFFKKNNFILIKGFVSANMIKEILLKQKSLINSIKGNLNIMIKLKNEKKQINIKKILIKNGLTIDAAGYIKNKSMSLKGSILYNGIRKKFNYYTKL